MKPLSSRRRPVEKLQWSAEMREFLGENFDDYDPNNRRKKAQHAQTSRTGMIIHHETDYQIKKRALHSSLNRRLDNNRKQLKKQNDFEDYLIYISFHPPQRPTKATAKKFHDKHVLEKVIDQRNEEYLQSIETLSNGSVADLRKARQLPPDRSGYVKSEHRVFYWG